jgi:hypothetical protein
LHLFSTSRDFKYFKLPYSTPRPIESNVKTRPLVAVKVAITRNNIRYLVKIETSSAFFITVAAGIAGKTLNIINSVIFIIILKNNSPFYY